MEECNLDWKKVFKEILGEKRTSQNVAFADEYETKVGNVTFPKLKNSIECDSSRTVNVKSSNNDTSKTKILNNEWSKVSYYDTVHTDASKESFIRQERPLKQLSQCSVQDEISISNVSRSDEVPKWDTAFKRILGNNSSKDVQRREDVESIIKRPDPRQKQNVPVENKKFYRKKVETYRNFKVDEEEKKVREIFARSRSFKLEYSVSNLNDLAGCGVDIFKCGQITNSSFEVKVPEESERLDDSYTDYSNLSVPVTGLIANIKPHTRNDEQNAPCVPLTETWDDDFLF